MSLSVRRLRGVERLSGPLLVVRRAPGMALGEAFSAPLHSVVGPVSQGVDQIVYRVLERSLPPATAAPEEKKAIRDQIVGTRQNEAFEVFKDELRERLKRQGKIKIHQERVDRWVKANG